MNRSVFLTIMIIGTLIAGMMLGNIPSDLIFNYDIESMKNNKIVQVFAQEYDDEDYYYDYYYNDRDTHKKPHTGVVESVFCTDSGLFADNYDNCPQKCE